MYKRQSVNDQVVHGIPGDDVVLKDGDIVSVDCGTYMNGDVYKRQGKKVVVKTWARASMISPDFVGHTVAVHNEMCIRDRN